MNLKILMPDEVFVDESVNKVVAEGEDGNFCLLQNHIDFVSSLVPGIFSFEKSDGTEGLVALDGGILVKQGKEVLVSTANAVCGDSLDVLNEIVENQYKQLDEREKMTRSVLAKLEIDTLRRFARLGEQ